jgi:ABC-2 type transport system permease protein
MISQGVMLRGATLASLWLPFLMLTVMAIVVFSGATLRFRRDLAPGRRGHRGAGAGRTAAVPAGSEAVSGT